MSNILVIRTLSKQTTLRIHGNTFGDAMYQVKRAYYDALMNYSVSWGSTKEIGFVTYNELLQFIPEKVLNSYNIFVEGRDEKYQRDSGLPTVRGSDALMYYEEIRVWQELEKMNLDQICSWLRYAAQFSKTAGFLLAKKVHMTLSLPDCYIPEYGREREELHNILSLSRHYACEQWNTNPAITQLAEGVPQSMF